MATRHIREQLCPAGESLGACTGLFSSTDCSWRLLIRNREKKGPFSGPSGLKQQEGGFILVWYCHQMAAHNFPCSCPAGFFGDRPWAPPIQLSWLRQPLSFGWPLLIPLQLLLLVLWLLTSYSGFPPPWVGSTGWRSYHSSHIGSPGLTHFWPADRKFLPRYCCPLCCHRSRQLLQVWSGANFLGPCRKPMFPTHMFLSGDS